MTTTTTPSPTLAPPAPILERRLGVDPRVAVRPEPFGALAYHYGNRRLVLLKQADIVRVVRALDDNDSVEATLRACSIDEARWPAFERALTSLTESEVLHERNATG